MAAVVTEEGGASIMERVLVGLLVIAAVAIVGLLYSSGRQAKRNEDEIVKSSLYPMQERFHNRLKNRDARAIDDLMQMLTTVDEHSVHKKHGVMLFFDVVKVSQGVALPARDADACAKWLMEKKKTLRVSDNGKIVLVK